MYEVVHEAAYTIERSSDDENILARILEGLLCSNQLII